jgi:hypothetical protein
LAELGRAPQTGTRRAHSARGGRQRSPLEQPADRFFHCGRPRERRVNDSGVTMSPRRVLPFDSTDEVVVNTSDARPTRQGRLLTDGVALPLRARPSEERERPRDATYVATNPELLCAPCDIRGPIATGGGVARRQRAAISAREARRGADLVTAPRHLAPRSRERTHSPLRCRRRTR